jgi:hypothetical protein
MLALSLGLLMVFVVTAILLADLERKRRRLVALYDRMAPLIDKKRRLPFGNMRRMASSPFHLHGLIDLTEREIGYLEDAAGIAPPADTPRFAGGRIVQFDQRLDALAPPAPAESPDRPRATPATTVTS